MKIFDDFYVELAKDSLMTSKGYKIDEAVHPARIDLATLNSNVLGICFCKYSLAL